jgi:transposase InsO family protein
MPTLNLNDPIELVDGNTYQYTGQSGSVIRLRSMADGQYQDMHIAELSQKAVGLPATFAPATRKFEQLPAKQRAKVMKMADHIQELITGINPSRETSLPEYDLATTTQNQRIDAKIRELKRSGQSSSPATLKRKIAAFREHGASALADQRSFRTDGPLDNLNPDIKDALCYVIEDQKNRSTGTKSRLIRETQVLLRSRFGGEAPELPSQASMYRYIDALTIGKHTTGSASTRRSLANRPKGPYSTRTEMLPGLEVQVDSTTMDVFIHTPSGKAVRPILTVLMDRATRLVLAFTFRLTATKAVDHVTLLAQALTPPQNRPDNSAFRHAVQRKNPNVPLMEHGKRKFYEMTRPYVHVRGIVMDNGKDYISDAFIAALQLHGIDVRFSAPRTPTSKPLVERNFGSISTLFTQFLKGYTGRSPEYRGHKVEEEGIMDIYALHELFDDWLLEVWNNRPHGGLRDRMDPQIKLTPAQMFTAASRLTSNLETTLTRDDYIAMLPTVYRNITSTGVVVNRREFDSVELNPLRNTRSNIARKKGKHEIKLDPYNPFYAWVPNPAGGWIECALRNLDADLYPHLEDRDFELDEEDEEDEGDDRATVAATTAALAGAPLHTSVVLPEATDQTPTAVTDGPTTDVFVID